MIGRGTRRFSAILTPWGIHCVEYRVGSGGLQVLRTLHDATPIADAATAARRLGNLVEAGGGRGALLDLGLAGFGAHHHVVTLPPAPPEVLRPVIARELRRFYPDLFAEGLAEPVLDWAQLPEPEGPSGPARDFLATAAPGALVRELHASLAARHIDLQHLTALPQALQRVYESFQDPSRVAVLVLMIPDAPVLGFFYQGACRLFAEPVREDATVEEGEALDALAEQVERGALFLRQRFRGAEPERVLLSAPAGEAEELRTALAERLGIPVVATPAQPEQPAALAALGPALDARSERPVTLLPESLRPTSPAERGVRWLLAAAAVVLVLGMAGWAVRGVLGERRAEARLETVATQIQNGMRSWAPVRETVGRRQEHAQRTALLRALAGGRDAPIDLLWTLQDAPPAIVIDELRVQREPDQWTGLVSGRGVASSSSAAADAVSTLYEQLGARFPEGSVELQNFGQPAPAPSPPSAEALEIGQVPVVENVAISFAISFIVPVSGDVTQ